LACQWRFNGSPLEGETTPGLALTKVEFWQLGYYDVAVSNSAGVAVSDPAWLLPALSGAQQKAHTVVCLVNQRQIHLAYRLCLEETGRLDGLRQKTGTFGNAARQGVGLDLPERLGQSGLAARVDVWDCARVMKKNVWLFAVLALIGVDQLEATAAGWLDFVPRYSRSVQYFGARRYVKPIAPQTQPPPAQAAPPATVSPTPPPLPGRPRRRRPAKNTAEKEAVLKRTIEFQKKRAEEGSMAAQYDLGKRYLMGDGLERDLAAARKWFEAAAKQGHEGAVARLEEVKKLETAAAAAAATEAAKKPKSAGPAEPQAK